MGTEVSAASNTEAAKRMLDICAKITAADSDGGTEVTADEFNTYIASLADNMDMVDRTEDKMVRSDFLIYNNLSDEQKHELDSKGVLTKRETEITSENYANNMLIRLGYGTQVTGPVGTGSAEKIAAYCKRHGLKFVPDKKGSTEGHYYKFKNVSAEDFKKFFKCEIPCDTCPTEPKKPEEPKKPCETPKEDCKTCKDGVDGTDGIDGTNGTNGTDGTDGTDGANGIDGKNGKNAPKWPLFAAVGLGVGALLVALLKGNGHRYNDCYGSNNYGYPQQPQYPQYPQYPGYCPPSYNNVCQPLCSYDGYFGGNRGGNGGYGYGTGNLDYNGRVTVASVINNPANGYPQNTYVGPESGTGNRLVEAQYVPGGPVYQGILGQFGQSNDGLHYKFG
jgi:hypothetical protein